MRQLATKTSSSSERPLAIIDVENAGFEEIHKLHLEFPHLSIVCTHRLADDAMWAEALSAGASDLCDTVRSGVQSCVQR